LSRLQSRKNSRHKSKDDISDGLQYDRNPVIVVSTAPDSASVIENRSACTDLATTFPSHNTPTNNRIKSPADSVQRRKSSSATTSTDMAPNCSWSRDDDPTRQGSLLDLEVNGSPPSNDHRRNREQHYGP
jgi:hypothetical protein